MTTTSVRLRSIPGARAVVGEAGDHTVIVDRPVGKAGGEGLGFNGGQLLALAIGGCLCNDFHYVAHEMGVGIESMSVDVAVTFEGAPLVATKAEVSASVTPTDPSADIAALMERARAISTVANSLARGVPVAFNAMTVNP